MLDKEKQLQYQEAATYISIDQMTISFLHNNQLISESEHSIRSEDFITLLAEKMSFEELGPVRKSKNINGYNATYKTEGEGLTLSYHSEWPEMGVSVNFTASAFHEYQRILREQEGYLVDGVDILKDLDHVAKSSGFKTRISRIDIAADYLNHGLSVDELHQKVLNREVKITDHRERREKKMGQHVGDAGSVQTFYIGRYSTRTGFLRVYNKKIEQTRSKQAINYEQALYCKDWVRVEAVFKDEQAHQITEILLAADDTEYVVELANLMTSRYRFLYADGSYHIVTQELMRYENLRTYKLSQSSRLYNLERSMNSFLSGQVQNTLYKVRKIKGEEYARAYWDSLYEHNRRFYKPTKEVQYFINKLKKSTNTEQ